MSFVHYRPEYLARWHAKLPALRLFNRYFECYATAPLDRSGTLKFPVRAHSMFPLPAMRSYGRSYEETCNLRAELLLARARDLDTEIYVFWSGGIDSTCALTSLIKMAPEKERIVVLLSDGSIDEFPSFYRAHIRGKLRCKSVMLFPYILGLKKVLVSGEGNDQLFGSDIIGSVAGHFGFDRMLEPYDRKLFQAVYEDKWDDAAAARFFVVNVFERLKENAPVELKTNFDMFWWINFVFKWQNVYTRTVSFAAARNRKGITPEYMRDYYAPFYNTTEFQLWSMNNVGERTKGGWRSYKWPAKELIYRFHKDAAYRDGKIKIGSLQYILPMHTPINFIDEKFEFRNDATLEELYVEDNDFIRS